MSLPACGTATPLPQPSEYQNHQSTKERTMLFYPYRNEFFIQMAACNTDPARANQLVEAIRARWTLLRGKKRYAGDPARSTPSPATSPVLTTERP
jgi:hypothetical protein